MTDHAQVIREAIDRERERNPDDGSYPPYFGLESATDAAIAALVSDLAAAREALQKIANGDFAGYENADLATVSICQAIAKKALG